MTGITNNQDDRARISQSHPPNLPPVNLTAIFEGTGSAVIALDRDWRYIYVSVGAEQIMQRTHEQLLGQCIYDVYPDIKSSPFWQVYTSAVEHQQFRSIEDYYSPLDTWFEAQCFPHPHGLYVQFRDIGAMKRVEAIRDESTLALQESAKAQARSETQLRLITDAFPALIGYINRDLVYTFCNQSYREWFGKDPAKMVGVSIRQFIGEAVFQQRLPYIERVLCGEHVRFQGTLPHFASGTMRETDTTYVPDRDEATGEVRGFFLLLQDVSATHAAKRELAAKNEEIITIFERQGDAFAAFDPEWRFTYVNYEAERILGKSRAELLEKRVWDIYPDASQTILYTEYLRAMQEQVPVSFELYYGPLVGWFEVRAYPSPSGLSAYFRNITARKIAEAEREQAAKERTQLLAELQDANLRQRRFLREMLFSLTEGHLFLCDNESDLPKPLSEALNPIALSNTQLRKLRQYVMAASDIVAINEARKLDFVTAASVAAMNAVVHAGSGHAQVHYDTERGTVQIWIWDKGKGIAEDSLHRATLEKGFSSAGTLGHGFWLMLKTADRIYLLTNTEGTTVILEQDRDTPAPMWLPAVNK